MSDHTFSISLKNVLKNIEDKQIEAIKYSVNFSMNTVYDNISSSVQDGGLSPYDNFTFTYGQKYRRKTHSNSRWYMRDRSSKVSISYELRNRAKYAKYLYTDEESYYHPNGWRSYDPHKEIKYHGKIYSRPAQLNSKLYNSKMELYNSYISKNIQRYLSGKQMKEEL